MYVPRSWLCDFADLPTDIDELVKAFNDLGLVVEGVTRVDGQLKGVVVGRVLDVSAIEGADKIRLAKVDIGVGEEQSIVCGAPNLEVGQKVPVATVGTVLPGGFEIGERKMKGIVSKGMICAADELGLSAKRMPGILVLDADAPIGAELKTALNLSDDAIFDLAIETNRPDAMCIAGIARDMAAHFKVQFTIPEYKIKEEKEKSADKVSVDVKDDDLCPRFTARVLTNVEVGSSPIGIQLRLLMAGMRPINNVVDASNYVMLELGQPTHPYDLNKLPGSGFIVRRSKVGEKLTTLDSVEREFVSTEDVLICDANDAPIGIGGVMGGESSEIDTNTTEVVLEAAYFAQMPIAWTSRRYSLRSEASARFERGTDPWGIERAVARFCSLLPTAKVLSGFVDSTSIDQKPQQVNVRVSRVNLVLGIELDAKTIKSLIEPIGFVVDAVKGDDLTVSIPSFRPDAEREADVIEEIARHYGYENIPKQVPVIQQVGKLTEYQKNKRKLRQLLTGMGINEAWTAPFLSEGDLISVKNDKAVIRLSNPMVEDEVVLRPSLLPGLLKAVAYNNSRQNHQVVLFEIGHTFDRPQIDGELSYEEERLGVVLSAPGRDAASAALIVNAIAKSFHVELEVRPSQSKPGLHPTRVADVMCSGEWVGLVGEIDPAVSQAFGIEGRVEWLELNLQKVLPTEVIWPTMKPVSRYPSSEFDLAFVVKDDVRATDIESTLRSAAGVVCESVTLFDVYRGQGVDEGSRSLAYRLRVASAEKTLSDSDVASVRQACIDAAESTHSAQLRS